MPDQSPISLSDVVVVWVISVLVLYFDCWYWAYKSMCHEKLFFFLRKSFWSPHHTATMKYVLLIII